MSENQSFKNEAIYDEYAIMGWPCVFFCIETVEKHNMKIERYCNFLRDGSKDLSFFQKIKLFFYIRYLTIYDSVLSIKKNRIRRNLDRFITAQHNTYQVALKEIKEAYKRTHWMWFIFPQLAGLGDSARAQKYAIANSLEARVYMQHPILGPRLLETSEAIFKLSPDICPTFLGFPDDLKLRSCMTLFSEVCPEYQIFQDVIDKFFEGEKDPLTLKILYGKKHKQVFLYYIR